MIDPKRDFETPVILHLTLSEANALIALLYETAPEMVTYGHVAKKLHEVINKAETNKMFDL